MEEDVIIKDVEHITQIKMRDCWYACMQMLLKQRWGEDEGKWKPQGVDELRKGMLGQKACFDGKFRAAHGLIEIGHLLNVDDIKSVFELLKTYGPFIVAGKFDVLRQGHCVVICGVNTKTEMVYRDNPAWGYGKAWKPKAYLKKIFTYQDGETIMSNAVVALSPLEPVQT